MKDAPLVSVIVAVRNSERFLAESLESVLSSTYRPIEVIVIDGHSSDQSKAIAGQFENVKVLNQIGSGIAAAYNQGISEARADFIAFNSADDIWLINKLELQMQYLLKHPDPYYVVGAVEFFLEAADSIPAGFRTELLNSPRTACIVETLLTRRALFDRVGNFDVTLKTAEDVDWFARTRDYGIAYGIIQSVVVKKRIHGENSSLATSNTEFLLSALRKSIERKQRQVTNATVG